MDASKRKEFVKSQVTSLKPLNFIAVALYFLHACSLPSFLEHPAVPDFFFAPVVAEFLGGFLAISIFLLKIWRPLYCDVLMEKYPISALILILSNCGIAWRFVGRVYVGSCPIGYAQHFCNISTAIHIVPLLHSFLLILNPLFVHILMDDGRLRNAVVLTWIHNLLCLLFAQAAVGDDTIFQFSWLLCIDGVVLKCLYDAESNSENNFLIQEERKLWAETEIRTSKELAESRTRWIRLEMANVAHDLRNPLQALSSGIQLINLNLSKFKDFVVRDYDCEAKLNEMTSILQEMESSSEFMNVKINRFIDVSKSSNNIEIKPRRTSFCVRDAIQWAVRIMTSFNKAVEIVVHEVATDKVEPYIISDKSWFEENILCYISNAVKHTPAGGTVTVRFDVISAAQSQDMQMKPELDKDRKYLLVQIEDTGIGVSESMRTVLFHPFSQAQVGAGGTGLGLYSLALRVLALKGSYGFQNNSSGVGACFSFAIPYVPDTEASNANTKDSESDASDQSVSIQNMKEFDVVASQGFQSNSTSETAPDLYGFKETSLLQAYEQFNYTGSRHEVLVVDDIPSNVKIVSRGLVNSGIEHVDIAFDGYKALEMMKVKQYSCVLMDAHMPIMDGFESTKRIRLWENECQCPKQFIICCSANDDEDTQRLAVASGMNAFLGKPFKVSSISSLLK